MHAGHVQALRVLTEYYCVWLNRTRPKYHRKELRTQKCNENIISADINPSVFDTVESYPSYVRDIDIVFSPKMSVRIVCDVECVDDVIDKSLM